MILASCLFDVSIGEGRYGRVSNDFADLGGQKPESLRNSFVALSPLGRPARADLGFPHYRPRFRLPLRRELDSPITSWLSILHSQWTMLFCIAPPARRALQAAPYPISIATFPKCVPLAMWANAAFA